jgi:hypothetical protein
VVCLAVAIPVAAHVNDVEADSQIATDGEIAVESTSVPSDGFLVVHRVTADGDPGEPIGHVPLEAGRQYATLGVTVAPSAWESWGDAREVWLVVHESGDDPGFDPDDDPIQRTLGGIAGERITVAKGPARAYVLAEDFEPKSVEDSATIRRVVAPEQSRLELRVRRPAGPGPVVGETTLPAGVHENVTVAVEGDVFGNSSSATLLARLTDPNGTPLRAGDRPIQSYVPVVDGTRESGPEILTPSGGDTTAEGDERRTAAGGGETTAGDGPGFTVAAALVAAVLAVLAVGLRRRR